jgi:hypothetical protein
MKTFLIACAVALAVMASGQDLAAAGAKSFNAKLAPTESFIPADAEARATFELSGDGREIRYELGAKGVELVTQSHIHLSPDIMKDESFSRRYRESQEDRHHGPIVVFLMQFNRQGITADGVLAEGTITQSDLVGPLRGYPLSELIGYMERGQAYVALHVLKKVVPDQLFCCPVGLRGSIRSGSS